MVLYIKNMVCNRCVLVVKQELEKVGLQALQVSLGEVALMKEPTQKQLSDFREHLSAVGFELLDDHKQQLIEQIKTLIIEKIQREIEEHFSISEYLAQKLYKDYGSISRFFSEIEAITVEHFFILQKIEKAKELLTYDELTLSEIAWQLGYSSVAHLSAQFKKVTGLTPTAFKNNHTGHRKSLDKVNSL